MYFVLSPAKSLNETDAVPINIDDHHSQPALINDSAELIQILKTKDPIDLQELMSISADLATLNAERNQAWRWHKNDPFTTDNAKAAGYLFDGDVYTGLDAYDLDDQEIDFAQQHLRMLSGLYGLLRPLDLMMPYRLEMGTKLNNTRGHNLYEFWGDIITDQINQDLANIDAKVLINLASDEYYKSVNEKKIQAEIIKPVFLDQKNGKYKVISFYAKKARGLMARYMIENQIDQIEGLKSFQTDGYYFDADSSLKSELVFKRDEQAA